MTLEGARRPEALDSIPNIEVLRGMVDIHGKRVITQLDSFLKDKPHLIKIVTWTGPSLGGKTTGLRQAKAMVRHQYSEDFVQSGPDYEDILVKVKKARAKNDPSQDIESKVIDIDEDYDFAETLAETLLETVENGHAKAYFFEIPAVGYFLPLKEEDPKLPKRTPKIKDKGVSGLRMFIEELDPNRFALMNILLLDDQAESDVRLHKRETIEDTPDSEVFNVLPKLNIVPVGYEHTQEAARQIKADIAKHANRRQIEIMRKEISDDQITPWANSHPEFFDYIDQIKIPNHVGKSAEVMFEPGSINADIMPGQVDKIVNSYVREMRQKAAYYNIVMREILGFNKKKSFKFVVAVNPPVDGPLHLIKPD